VNRTWQHGLLQRWAEPAARHPCGGRQADRARCGPIVGLFEGATYEEDRQTLTPGDWLIVFSDGISEAISASGDEYGEARIIDCIQRNRSLDPSRLLDALFSDVRDFARGPRRATTSRRWCRSIRATARHKPAHHEGQIRKSPSPSGRSFRTTADTPAGTASSSPALK